MSNQITLYIDTSNSQVTKVAIIKDGVTSVFEKKTDPATKSQNVLLLIEKALNEEGLTLKEISAIEVNCGPGSFTGTRVGVTVANTLGWVLGIPVNGKKQAVVTYAESKFD